ncbi:MAG: hypothetical protein ACRDOB_07985, partial [Streptosporangiaceae bacterium]
APVNLYSVACASTSHCTAVGLYTDSSGYQQGLLLTGSGSSWTAAEAPLPAGTDLNYYPYVSLVAVTCPSVTQCVAVGDYNTASGQHGLLLTGSGSSWTALQEPGFLNAVTCPSATACVAVGGAIVTGSGSSWTATTSPLPASDLNPELTAVTCRSASSCVAVGSYQVSSSSGGSLPLLVTGSGSSWTAVKAPLVAGGPRVPAEALDTVSCPAASSCVAIGTFADANNKAQILLMSESGSSWSAAEGPLPSNAAPFSATGKSSLSPPHAVSLTCLSTSNCVAVGSYTDTAPQTEPLLLSGPDTVG